MNFLKRTAVNWKTSVAGVVAFLSVFFQQMNFALDGVEDTVPDWNIVVMAVGILIASLNAKDSDKSTEQNKVE